MASSHSSSSDEKGTLDEQIQDMMGNVVHERQNYCSAIAKYASKTLTEEIEAVKNSKCVLPKKNIVKDSKYNLETPLEDIFPIKSPGDDELKLSEILKMAEEIKNDEKEMEEIKKLKKGIQEHLLKDNN